MLPNALTPLIVAATLALATAIIDVAGLGFLGLGPPDPRTPEWGTMLTDATKFLRQAPWLDLLPRARDRHQRDRLQPARRRPARVARPAAEAMTGARPRRRPASEALLRSRTCVVRFRTHDGDDPRRQRRHASSVEEGERLGLVGESGCGKSVTNLAIIRLLPKPAGRIEGGAVMFDGQDLVKLSEAEIRDLRGKDIAMIFQDPMTSLNPVLTIEEQMVETIRAHRKVDARRRAKARAIELLAMVGIPKPETRLQELPAPVLGRHAPARDDRDGARARAEADDRRRADDRPRRHDPGPGARAPPAADHRDRARRSS